MPSSKKIKPASIYLTAEEQEQIQKIAQALGVSPHALRQYAVKKLLKDWARGWRPKKGRKVVTTLEP